MVIIPIRATAQALEQFESMSEIERAEFEALVTEELRKRSVKAMLARMERMADEAERNGLTPEILEQLLKEIDRGE